MELEINDMQFGNAPPGAKLTPVDWLGTGEKVGDFSLRTGKDGEPVLMLTVDKQYLEDSWKAWVMPLPEKDNPLTAEDFYNHLAIKKLT